MPHRIAAYLATDSWSFVPKQPFFQFPHFCSPPPPLFTTYLWLTWQTPAVQSDHYVQCPPPASPDWRMNTCLQHTRHTKCAMIYSTIDKLCTDYYYLAVFYSMYFLSLTVYNLFVALLSVVKCISTYMVAVAQKTSRFRIIIKSYWKPTNKAKLFLRICLKKLIRILSVGIKYSKYNNHSNLLCRSFSGGIS